MEWPVAFKNASVVVPADLPCTAEPWCSAYSLISKQPLASSSAGNEQPVVVDYNIAVVFELSRYSKVPCQLAKLPENPIGLFWDMTFAEFAGWTPSEWNGSLKHIQKWLKERFGGKNASQYTPVTDMLEFAEH
jgi:hypothetical protein